MAWYHGLSEVVREVVDVKNETLTLRNGARLLRNVAYGYYENDNQNDNGNNNWNENNTFVDAR